MSNLQSVSASTSFSAPILDATSASHEELDPRFVEELQGAIGHIESESPPPSAPSDAASQEADSASSDAASGLQNLPLMPWAMLNMPANFAPQQVMNAGAQADASRVDALISVAAVDGGVLQAPALSTAPVLPATARAADAVPAPGADRAARDAAALAAFNGEPVVQDPMTADVATSVPVEVTASHGSPPVTQSAPGGNTMREETAAPVSQLPDGPNTAESLSNQATPAMHTSAKGAAILAANESAAHARGMLASASPKSGVMTADPTATSNARAVEQAAPVAQNGSFPLSGAAPGTTPGDAPVSQVAAFGTETADLTTPTVVISQTSAGPTSVPSTALPQALASPAAALSSSQAAVGAQATEAVTPLPALAERSETHATTSPDADAVAAALSAHEASLTTALATPGPSVVTTPATTGALSQAVATLPVADAVVAPAQSGTPSVSPLPHEDRDAGLERLSLERLLAHTAGVGTNSAPAQSASAGAPASVAVASSTSSSSASAVAQDETPESDAFQAMPGGAVAARPVGFFPGNELPATGNGNPSGASAVASGSVLTAESRLASGSGASAGTTDSAESTFASSFVQALMGHAHQPLVADSQALEVVPAPTPIAPHQVRFDAGQVQVEVVRLVKQGGGQVVMELTPPDESKFKIDLSISQQGVARLVVDGASESTRLRLEQTVSGLQEQFQQMGLQLQLDMRQPQQQHAQARPDTWSASDLPGSMRAEGLDARPQSPVTGRPVWEQSQVYLVA